MASSALTLPRKGSEEEWIMEPRFVSNSKELMVQYKCRYGSSMKLIAQGENLIADEFTSSNPNKDWKKYQKLGKELFYCIIEDMSSDVVVCVARSILDFPSVENSKNSKVQKTIYDHKRMILDYIHTAETCRGQGLAADLIRFLQRISKAEDSDFYVLSIEESQGYFLSKFDMILEQDQLLQENYNCFSDTFLLKSPDNTTGSKDTKLHEAFIEKDTDINEDQDDVEKSENESSDADSDVEKAIQESLQSTNINLSSANNVGIIYNNSNEELSEDQQIEYAIALSLEKESQTPRHNNSSISVADKTINTPNETNQNNVQHTQSSENVSSTLSDEEMLNQAIVLSLSNEICDVKPTSKEPNS